MAMMGRDISSRCSKVVMEAADKQLNDDLRHLDMGRYAKDAHYLVKAQAMVVAGNALAKQGKLMVEAWDKRSKR